MPFMRFSPNRGSTSGLTTPFLIIAIPLLLTVTKETAVISMHREHADNQEKGRGAANLLPARHPPASGTQILANIGVRCKLREDAEEWKLSLIFEISSNSAYSPARRRGKWDNNLFLCLRINNTNNEGKITPPFPPSPL